MKKRKARFYDKPGWLTYGLLGAFFLGAVFPLWWSFVMASRQASDINAVPPVVIPGPNFLENVVKAFQTDRLRQGAHQLDHHLGHHRRRRRVLLDARRLRVREAPLPRAATRS